LLESKIFKSIPNDYLKIKEDILEEIEKSHIMNLDVEFETDKLKNLKKLIYNTFKNTKKRREKKKNNYFC